MNMDQAIFDLAIVDGTMVSSSSVFKGHLGVDQGRVVSVSRGLARPQARKTISAEGKLVLPGVIDAHLHPVYADRMGRLSRAYAAGGVTTLVPYIGAFKAWGGTGGLKKSLDDFIAEGREKSLLDFSVHLSLNSQDLGELGSTLEYAASLGVKSYKIFTAYQKRGMFLSDQEILKVMTEVVRVGGLLAAHCENGAVIDFFEDRAILAGRTSPEAFGSTHPDLSEAEAVFRFLCLAKMVDCPVYLPHLSTWQALEVLRLARSWAGPPIFAETCPHYLDLTDKLMGLWGTRAKVSPPLRSQEHLEPLWAALKGGLIDVVASDHAGHSSLAKAPHFSDVYQAPTGLPGGDLLLRVMYDRAVAKGRLSLPELVRLLCEKPARIFGLWPTKGSLEPGADADLVIFNPELERVIDGPNPLLKADYTLYHGKTLKGLPELVIRGGEVIFENGRVVESNQPGRYLAAWFDHWPKTAKA
ncbi:MAG: amidohydrolase family protein [Deltaproteobacteria bacterium]|jgi:dihydropyrimidinase|nr:amidohydrolase family protein [Deltaproteobacteria bacterium]